MEKVKFGVLMARLHGRLVRRVEGKKVSRATLAKTAGISLPQLSNIIAGRRQISLDNADGILEALDLDVSDLFTRNEKDQ